MTISIENGYLDAHFDRAPAEAAGAEAVGLIYGRDDGTTNYNLAIRYDGFNQIYYLQIREGSGALIDVNNIPHTAGDYFRFEILRQHLVAYQSTDQENWVKKLTIQVTDHMAPGDWYLDDWDGIGSYVTSNITEVGRDLETFFLVGSHQIYDRPKTISGQHLRSIEGQLNSYSPGATVETLFEGNVQLPDLTQREVRITHNAAHGGSLTLLSGGSLVGSPTYYTYSTVFTVNPTSQTLSVKLEAYPVTIVTRDTHSSYGVNGDAVTLECPIASNPTLLQAMHDHYAAVVRATRYEFSMRDDASLEVGDEIDLPLLSARVYGQWNYKLPTALLSTLVDTPLWSTTVSNVVPVVLTRIQRRFDGATDADCLAITNIDP